MSHPEHEQWTEWVGDGFDAESFDASRVDAVLARLTWRTGQRR